MRIGYDKLRENPKYKGTIISVELLTTYKDFISKTRQYNYEYENRKRSSKTSGKQSLSDAPEEPSTPGPDNSSITNPLIRKLTDTSIVGPRLSAQNATELLSTGQRSYLNYGPNLMQGLSSTTNLSLTDMRTNFDSTAPPSGELRLHQVFGDSTNDINRTTRPTSRSSAIGSIVLPPMGMGIEKHVSIADDANDNNDNNNNNNNNDSGGIKMPRAPNLTHARTSGSVPRSSRLRAQTDTFGDSGDQSRISLTMQQNLKNKDTRNVELLVADDEKMQEQLQYRYQQNMSVIMQNDSKEMFKQILLNLRQSTKQDADYQEYMQIHQARTKRSESVYAVSPFLGIGFPRNKYKSHSSKSSRNLESLNEAFEDDNGNRIHGHGHRNDNARDSVDENEVDVSNIQPRKRQSSSGRRMNKNISNESLAHEAALALQKELENGGGDDDGTAPPVTRMKTRRRKQITRMRTNPLPRVSAMDAHIRSHTRKLTLFDAVGGIAQTLALLNDTKKNEESVGRAATPPPVTIQEDHGPQKKQDDNNGNEHESKHQTQQSNITDASELNIERGNLLQIPGSRSKLEKVELLTC